jgi:elongation factor G
MRALSRLRSFGVLAHVDAGKTTLSERLLFVAGRTRAIGEVHDGGATLDHLAEERARGITITAAATDLAWDDHVLTLVDTPGHVDFTAEVERSLRVLDGAVVVLDGVAGVEPQTTSVWRRADDHDVPRVVVVNKLDRVGADFDACLAAVRRDLDSAAVAVHLPVGEGRDFRTIVDLVSWRAHTWPDPEDPRTIETVSVDHLDPAVVDRARRARIELVEAAAAVDAELLDHPGVLDDPASVDASVLSTAIGRATRARLLVPVLAAAALSNVGIQPVLDAVIAWLPSPEDRTESRGAIEEVGPFVGLVAKVSWSASVRTVWLRVLRGRLHRGDKVLDPATGKTERVARLLRLHAGSAVDIDEATAGQVVAVTGLASVVTGGTVTDPDHPVTVAAPSFPTPLVGVAIEPRTRADQDKLARALARLVDEDPTLTARVDARTGETILSGLGGLHLEVARNRLASDHGTNVVAGAPTVAHRVTVDQPIKGHEERFVRQRGGPGQFAVITIDVEPNGNTGPDSVTVDDKTTGGVLPAAFAEAVRRGIIDTAASGIDGWPIVGITVTITDAKTHANDSNEHAFRAAGATALLTVVGAGHVVLEPVVTVRVTCTQPDIGPVLGLLGARGADVTHADDEHVTARLPVAQALDLTDALRSVTQGRAAHTTEDAGWQPVR